MSKYQVATSSIGIDVMAFIETKLVCCTVPHTLPIVRVNYIITVTSYIITYYFKQCNSS